MNPKHILITGGAGFIGSHTSERLLAQGKLVTIIDNLSTGKLANLDLQHPNLQFIQGDILDFPVLSELVNQCDAVLHLAAIASVPKSIEDPIYSTQVNTVGTLNVLEAIRRTGRPIRLVMASSSAVYGDTVELPCEEKGSRGKVLSPYALQKQQSEEFAHLYGRQFGIKSLALRYFNVYGPRQDPSSPYSGVISLFLNAYRQQTNFTIYGDGSQSRDFIYVKDVAEANALALHNEYTGAINIATGCSQTLLDLVQFIEKAGKLAAKYHFKSARAGDIQHSFGSPLMAKQAIGFAATTPLQEGIKMMVAM